VVPPFSDGEEVPPFSDVVVPPFFDGEEVPPFSDEVELPLVGGVVVPDAVELEVPVHHASPSEPSAVVASSLPPSFSVPSSVVESDKKSQNINFTVVTSDKSEPHGNTLVEHQDSHPERLGSILG
jgi:hypothetical protein